MIFRDKDAGSDRHKFPYPRGVECKNCGYECLDHYGWLCPTTPEFSSGRWSDVVALSMKHGRLLFYMTEEMSRSLPPGTLAGLISPALASLLYAASAAPPAVRASAAPPAVRASAAPPAVRASAAPPAVRASAAPPVQAAEVHDSTDWKAWARLSLPRGRLRVWDPARGVHVPRGWDVKIPEIYPQGLRKALSDLPLHEVLRVHADCPECANAKRLGWTSIHEVVVEEIWARSACDDRNHRALYRRPRP